MPALRMPPQRPSTPKSAKVVLETELNLAEVCGIAVVSDLNRSKADQTALADAANRATLHWQVPVFEASTVADLAAIADDQRCAQIVTGFAPTGPIADALDKARPLLADRKIALAEHQRRWDQLAWSFCAKGFFQLKSRIPSLLQEQGIIAHE